MRTYTILKKTRVFIGIAIFLLTLALFIDIYEKIDPEHINQALYLQFVPSLLQFIQTLSLAAAGGFILVVVLTLLLGRLYCSTICPLGIIQDFITWLSKKTRSKRVHHKFRNGHPAWRYSFLAIMISAVVFGAGAVMVWLDPFSIAGRFFGYLALPLTIEGNNMAASFLQQREVFTLFHIIPATVSWVPLSLTILMLLLIVTLSWTRGRFFCNVICPVGTLLGIISRASLLKVKFIPSNCNLCGDCSSSCKSECINLREYSIDTTRCVTCFNCLGACSSSAITLGLSKPSLPRLTRKPPITKPEGKTRREMVVTIIALAAGTRVYALKRNQLGENKQNLTINRRDYFPTPPGSGGIERFNALCTACSLCVAGCPERVLQPSVTQHGLAGFMQPFMDYSKSLCRYDCNKCGTVCPTGAILPLPLEEKQRVQIGKAIFVLNNCIVHVDGFNCGDCADFCPTGAVVMVPYRDRLWVPSVKTEICIGCGACEHGCPMQPPFKAIYVNGKPTHQVIDHQRL